MITTAASYDYTMQGLGAETEATLVDGRTMIVNKQYSRVFALHERGSTCPQVNKIGGKCNCGSLDGVDAAALVADARAHGKFGPRPRAPYVPSALEIAAEAEMAAAHRANPPCPHCHSYCYGDCQAN